MRAGTSLGAAAIAVRAGGVGGGGRLRWYGGPIGDPSRHGITRDPPLVDGDALEGCGVEDGFGIVGERWCKRGVEEALWASMERGDTMLAHPLPFEDPHARTRGHNAPIKPCGGL